MPRPLKPRTPMRMGKSPRGAGLRRTPRSTTASAEQGSSNADALQQPAQDDGEGVTVPVQGFDPNEDLLRMSIPPAPEVRRAIDESGARLIITRIELENFKSFYGHHTIGPLHKSFTAIIGPNGSGKSNVIDSLLFVFGYRAAKIRSKKLGLLIHSSTGRENLTQCSVTVHMQKIIDKGSTWELVEGTEISFSRTAYRDHSSRYWLNGRPANFKDVCAELHAVGIDIVHNRFLILQGEVEQISLMRPRAMAQGEEGMLEYLEDIIGSVRLKEPIEKLRYKLDLIEEERTSQLVRVKQADKEKGDMERPLREVAEQVELENSIALTTNKILSAKSLVLRDKMDEAAPQRESVEQELVQARAGLLETGEKLKAAKRRKTQTQKELNARQEELGGLSGELRDREQASTKLDYDKKDLASHQKKLKADIAKEEKKIEELMLVPETATKRVDELKLLIEEAEACISSNNQLIAERLSTVEERTRELSDAKKGVEAKLGEHVHVEDRINSELLLAQGRITNLQREEEVQRDQLSALVRRMSSMEESLSHKTRELRNGKEALPIVQRHLEGAESALTTLRERHSQLTDRVRELQAHHEQSKQRAHEYRSSNRLSNALMKEKAEGRIPGIFGRLGDLGAIDERYDVAISTTCYALDNWVVDSIATAQQCIQFLKKHGLGVATFIALDRQEHLVPRMRNRPATPEDTARLFDLVRVEDEKVLPAFYFALTDTLVVEDITIAARISNNRHSSQRWRVVTLRGELVETSGTMTGGESGQRRGRIGQTVKVRTRQSEGPPPEEIGQRLNEAREELNEVREKLASTEKERDKRRAERARLETAISKGLADDIKALEESIASMRKQVEAQRTRVDEAVANPELIQCEQAKIEKLKQENEDTAEQVDALRLRLFELTEKIDSANSDILGACQQHLREAEEKRADAEKEMVKQKSALALNSRHIGRANARKDDLKSDLSAVAGKFEKLDEQRNELEEALERLREAIEEKKAQIEQCERTCTEATKEEKTLSAEEFESQQQAKRLEAALREISEKLAVWEEREKAAKAAVRKLKVYYFGDLLQQFTNKRQRVLGSEARDDAEGSTGADAEEPEALSQLRPFDEGDSGDEFEPLDDQSDAEGEMPGGSGNEGVQVVVAAQPRQGENPVKRYLRRVPEYSEEALRSFNVRELKSQLSRLEQLKANRRKALNVGIVLDYMEKLDRCEVETSSLREISQQYDLHQEFHSRLEKQRLQEFMDGYRVINGKLKEMYQMITFGGDAQLDLCNTLDPFRDGVSFSVRPPKKSWKQISNLSGGEKTLASLALVFGLHHYRPCPLYVMDEIDAALDFRNVAIIASYIREKTRNAQFVVVSLRNNMFERGDYLIGVYKVADCTSSAQIHPREVDEQLKKDLMALKLKKRGVQPLRQTNGTVQIGGRVVDHESHSPSAMGSEPSPLASPSNSRQHTVTDGEDQGLLAANVTVRARNTKRALSSTDIPVSASPTDIQISASPTGREPSPKRRSNERATSSNESDNPFLV